MELWQLLLYAAASGLALRCLAGLMTAHKYRLQNEFRVEQDRQKRQDAERVRAEKARQLREKRTRDRLQRKSALPPSRSDAA